MTKRHRWLKARSTLLKVCHSSAQDVQSWPKSGRCQIKTSWSSNFPCMLWLKCYCNPHVGTGALILPTLYVDSRALSLHIRRKVLQGLLSIVLPETSPLHSAYTRSSISEDVPQWYNSSKYWQTSHCNSSYKWSLNLEWNLFLNDCWCIIECQPWDINIVTPPSPSLQWVKHISQCTGEYFPYLLSLMCAKSKPGHMVSAEWICLSC